MRSSVAYVILALAFSVDSGVALAQPPSAEIRFVPGSAAGARDNEFRVAHISIIGEIRKEELPILHRALERALKETNVRTHAKDPLVIVQINSPGGNVGAAMAMGRLLRTYAAEAWVPPGGKCASACVLVVAGAVARVSFDRSRFGIHRPRFEPELFAGLSRSEAESTYGTLAAAVQEYLSEMGLPEQLFASLMQVPSGKMRWLSDREAKSLGLIGEDPAYAEWIRARAQQTYPPGFLEGIEKYVECFNAGQKECHRHLPKVNR
jgi:ATP-dependent protease ClpP protease subunit